MTVCLLLVSLIRLPGADPFAPPPGGWPAEPAVGGGVLDLTELGSANAKVLIAVPEDYQHDEARPLAIVLHGGPGGRATDMAGVFRGPLTERGVISVYPQALLHQLLDWNYPHSSAYLCQIIREVARRYHIDPHRIYLLGHSMGGGGVWAQGAVLADLWAGLGPLSGWSIPNPAPDFTRLKDLPMYCLHGAKDRNVPAKLSRMGFERLAKLGSPQKIFTERPEGMEALQGLKHIYRELQGVGHNVFDPRKKRGPELALLLDWLLQHRRPDDAPADLEAAERSAVEWGEPFGWQPNDKLGTYRDEDSPASD